MRSSWGFSLFSEQSPGTCVPILRGDPCCNLAPGARWRRPPPQSICCRSTLLAVVSGHIAPDAGRGGLLPLPVRAIPVRRGDRIVNPGHEHVGILIAVALWGVRLARDQLNAPAPDKLWRGRVRRRHLPGRPQPWPQSDPEQDCQQLQAVVERRSPRWGALTTRAGEARVRKVLRLAPCCRRVGDNVKRP